MKIPKLYGFASILSATLLTASALASPLSASSTGAEIVEALSQTPQLNLAISADKPMLSKFSTDPRFHGAPMSYIQTLRNGLSMSFLFSEPSGVGEGYSIGEHTTRVIDVYQRQKAAYGISNFPKVAGVQSWDRLMIYTLAFHDIGKSIAFRGGDKSRETIYSVPLASDLLAAESFSTEEVKIGTALIDAHQLIGDALRSFIPMNRFVSEIRAHAQMANIDVGLFYSLFEIVYVADAGSYPILEHSVFETVNGRMVPKSPLYPKLRQNFF